MAAGSRTAWSPFPLQKTSREHSCGGTHTPYQDGKRLISHWVREGAHRMAFPGTNALAMSASTSFHYLFHPVEHPISSYSK